MGLECGVCGVWFGILCVRFRGVSLGCCVQVRLGQFVSKI